MNNWEILVNKIDNNLIYDSKLTMNGTILKIISQNQFSLKLIH